ncbi:hypothetical protein A0J61_00691 [Choanephora cucurbitarum]|uniref:Uncharacterized protein n=1 Tax=Choanephora cucurbitarum TaxID=101091 RepID=A0A1C7NQP4_9FUNG|nr:hypothetical protein A0J61_00691 [Choanephora cucurbitarum]
MTKLRKPKCPSTLEGKTIRNDLRATLELPGYLFVPDYSSWDVSAVVDDYFLFNQSPDKTGHDLFKLAVQSLQNFIDSEQSTKSEKRFSKKFLEYFQQPSNKKQFLEHCRDCERKLRLHNSAALLKEVESASNEFVDDHLREKLKRES